MRALRLKVIGTAIIISFLGIIMTAGLAAAAPKYKWKFGVPWPRPTQNEYHSMFCDLVKKYSNGQIELTYYPDGQLGTHDEHFHAVQEGSVQISMFAPYVNLIPGGMLNWMPWTIESWAEAKIAFEAGNGVLWKVMEDAYNEVGMHMLYQTSFGAYGLGNRQRPIRTPDDLKNLKMRVSASLGLVRALENMGKGHGMTLQTIPWGDLYDALSKGVVDGCWSMWPSLVEERHGEVLKYYSDLNFAWDTNNVVINKDAWEKLPQDLKSAISKAALEVEAKLYERQESLEVEFKKKLSEIKGFQMIPLTPEERDAFRARSNTPAIWDELCKPWLDKKYPGQNMTQKIQDELEKIHKEVAAKK
jgi:C4-dicarboxylate-binding protein DctP